jgi:hypothetical protein
MDEVSELMGFTQDRHKRVDDAIYTSPEDAQAEFDSLCRDLEGSEGEAGLRKLDDEALYSWAVTKGTLEALADMNEGK